MIFIIIIGMAFVTILPRVVPSFIVDKLELKPWLNRWLNAIPYAALGALIFPGILMVKEGSPIIGVIGGIVAIILAYLGMNVIFVVFGAIVTVFLLTM